MRVTIAVLVHLAVAAGPAAAQRPEAGAGAPPDTAPVPRELVAALFGGFGPRAAAPEITVGRLPGEFPPEALPDGAVILGGLVAPRRDAIAGAPQTAVARVPLPPVEALAAAERRIAGAGWRRAEAGALRGGFVPAPTARPATFCRDSVALTAWATPRPGGGSLLRLTLTSGARFAPCSIGAGPRRADLLARDWGAIPTLHAPRDAVTLGGGSTAGGMDAREASTRLDVALAPKALLAHYAAQLRAAGWALGAPLAAGAVAAQAAEWRDAEGRSWHALLGVVALAGTREREVVLRLVRPVGQRR